MRKTTINYGFPLFVTVICLVTFTLEMINNRFWLNDFQVYYSASRNFFSGDQVYRICYDMGSGYYKYSPVILFFFLPYTILSYQIAAIIHFFILGFAFWYTFTLIVKIFKKYFFTYGIQHEGLLLSLSFTCILLFFTREMHLGNVNIILLLFSCQALWYYLEHKPVIGSLFLGLVVLTKPFYLLLILPLIWRKNWKAVASLGFILAGGGLIPFLYKGFANGLVLYSNWFNTIFAHDQGFPGKGSMDYFLRQSVLPTLPGYTEYLIILLMCAFATWFILANIKMERTAKVNEIQYEMNFIFEWFLLISMLPVLFKTDWVQILLSTPMIIFIIFYISFMKRYWLIPVMIVLFFLFGANSDDLLGKELSAKILNLGFMGLSNFILIIISLFLFLDFRKVKHPLFPLSDTFKTQKSG